jgi:hypothetical protein
MNTGLNQNWSTVVAAAIVVIVAAALIRKREVSPVVLITGVLPLGATVAMFNMISELMRVSSLTGDSLNVSSVAFVSNMGKAFTTSLAIAVGLAGGIYIAELLRRGRNSV